MNINNDKNCKKKCTNLVAKFVNPETNQLKSG